MPGTPKTKTTKASGPLDLDALLAPPPLAPQDITLGGETFSVRRDFTGAEVSTYWTLLNGNADPHEALKLLLGGDEPAKRFKAMIDPLPISHVATVMNRLYRVVGMLARDESGESPAS